MSKYCESDLIHTDCGEQTQWGCGATSDPKTLEEYKKLLNHLKNCETGAGCPWCGS